MWASRRCARWNRSHTFLRGEARGSRSS
jgi:hypothetical protein